MFTKKKFRLSRLYLFRAQNYGIKKATVALERPENLMDYDRRSHQIANVSKKFIAHLAPRGD